MKKTIYDEKKELIFEGMELRKEIQRLKKENEGWINDLLDVGEVRDKLLAEKKELDEDRILAKQCLGFKGCFCKNKECINVICPLHKDVPNNTNEFKGLKKK